MKQRQFNQIQSNFRRFLSEVKIPPVKKQSIAEQPIRPTERIMDIEKTSIFGREDEEIGYKMISIDKDGNEVYHIIPIQAEPTHQGEFPKTAPDAPPTA